MSQLTRVLVVGLIFLPLSVQAQRTGVRGRIVNGADPLSEAAVYLVPVAAEPPATEPLDGMVVDQVHLRFKPRVSVVTPGTVVRFLNSDPLPHNVFGLYDGGRDFVLGTYPRGAFEEHVFLEPGVHVVLCHIHPEMAAYVLVVDTPYLGTTGADGTFALDSVPPDRYTLTAWHPRYRRRLEEIDVVVGPDGIDDLEIRLGGSR